MPGPSGFTSAFTHPDPLDPNDAQRQRTQARPKDYPYDQQTSYGKAIGTADGGGKYQIGGTRSSRPPVPRNEPASDFRPQNAWDLAYEALSSPENDTREIGPQGPDAATMGYGSHGMMGEEGEDDDLMDLLKIFGGEGPQAQRPRGLLVVLSADPDGGDVDCDDDTIYGDHVYAPGAEDDEGEVVDLEDEDEGLY